MKSVVVVGLVAGCISPVMHFGGGKSAHEAQHDTLGEFMPAPLSTDGTWHGDVRTLPMRVWADDEYRAQHVHWEQTFGESLEYANAVLASAFGVRFRAEYTVWDRHAPGATLDEALTSLAEHDPGDKAFAVVGLTSSLGLVSATFDQIGVAHLGGQHVVVRGYADLEERAAFARAFPDLSGEERDHALEARRRHKTAAVLLHELGHNLGVAHEADPDGLMNASYSIQATGFSTDARATIRATIDHRLTPGSEPGPATTAPATTAAAAPRSHGHLTVHVHLTAAGEIQLEDHVVSPSELSGKLAADAANDPGAELIVVKDKAVPSAQVVDVIDRAKLAGLTKFTIAASP